MKKMYVKPMSQVFTIATNYGLLDSTSFESQHEKPHHGSGPAPSGGAKKWGLGWADESSNDDESDDLTEDEDF